MLHDKVDINTTFIIHSIMDSHVNDTKLADTLLAEKRACF